MNFPADLLNVIGGNGAFVTAVSNFTDFGDVVKLKIGREIATPVPEPITIFSSILALGFGAACVRQTSLKGSAKAARA